MITEKQSAVDPEWIKQQRQDGWPDMHPEDYCHKCGTRNMCWVADRSDWIVATEDWVADTGREGICCPQCFADMHEAATSVPVIWQLSPAWKATA